MEVNRTLIGYLDSDYKLKSQAYVIQCQAQKASDSEENSAALHLERRYISCSTVDFEQVNEEELQLVNTWEEMTGSVLQNNLVCFNDDEIAVANEIVLPFSEDEPEKIGFEDEPKETDFEDKSSKTDFEDESGELKSVYEATEKDIENFLNEILLPFSEDEPEKIRFESESKETDFEDKSSKTDSEDESGELESVYEPTEKDFDDFQNKILLPFFEDEPEKTGFEHEPQETDFQDESNETDFEDELGETDFEDELKETDFEDELGETDSEYKPTETDLEDLDSDEYVEILA